MKNILMLTALCAAQAANGQTLFDRPMQQDQERTITDFPSAFPPIAQPQMPPPVLYYPPVQQPQQTRCTSYRDGLGNVQTECETW